MGQNMSDKHEDESGGTTFEKQGVSSREAEQLGLNTSITRRDFVGSALLGAGVGLLGMAAPGTMRRASAQTIASPLTGLGPDWTGYGGIGDYSRSNGNTHEVVNATHAGVRAQKFDGFLATAAETGETYDVIVVGAGHAGCEASLAAARMGARVLDGALIRTRAFIGAGAVVGPGKVVDTGELWLGNPARMVRRLSDREIEQLHYSAAHYVRLKDEYIAAG